jgi:hypothetical protein
VQSDKIEMIPTVLSKSLLTPECRGDRTNRAVEGEQVGLFGHHLSFENLRSLTSFPIFPTWEDLMAIFAMVVILDPPWVVLSVLAKS